MAIHPRISENNRFDSAMDRISNVKAISDDVNETAVTGRKLKRLSDDPVSTVKVLRARNKLSNIDQFKKIIEFGKGFLAKSEDVLTSIQDALVRVKELSIQQANTTYNDSARKAVAEEVKSLRGHIIQLGNASYNDKFVFGGFQTKQPPIESDGTFTGDDGKIFVQTDEDTFTPLNVSGRNIFDVPVEQQGLRPPLPKILENIYNSLENYNPDELHENMNYLDSAMDNLLTELSSLGAKGNLLHEISQGVDKNEVQLNTDIDKLESADMTKSAMDLKRAESVLQFTMQSTSKMITPTLLDFLR